MRNTSTSHYYEDTMCVPVCVRSIKKKLGGGHGVEWDMLSKCIKKRKPVCLFYSGMSGIVSANALACILHAEDIPYALFYVRKKHEKSHGQEIEYFYSKGDKSTITLNDIHTKSSLFFCDDLVDTGATKKYVVKSIREQYNCFFGRVIKTLITSQA